jgi:hypothetical protein
MLMLLAAFASCRAKPGSSEGFRRSLAPFASDGPEP